jgi:hypothetical protein
VESSLTTAAFNVFQEATRLLYKDVGNEYVRKNLIEFVKANSSPNMINTPILEL